MSASHYQHCYLNSLGSDNVLECVADKLQQDHEFQRSNMVNWLFVVTGKSPRSKNRRVVVQQAAGPSNTPFFDQPGAGVFFMQTGFAMLCAGCVRKKNIQKYVQWIVCRITV